MKFLLDQGLPYSLKNLLRANGYEASHVRDVSLSNAPDAEIIRHAYNHQYHCLTLDADFHTILALSGNNKPSVIRFRIEGLKAENYLQILQQALPRLEIDLERGALISIQRETIRIHALPVKRQE